MFISEYQMKQFPAIRSQFRYVHSVSRLGYYNPRLSADKEPYVQNNESSDPTRLFLNQLKRYSETNFWTIIGELF